MTQTNKIIVSMVVVAVLLIGIGYAAIKNITLNISGTASADPSQTNFKVVFSGVPKVSNENKVKAAVTDDINATLNVEDLVKAGEYITATYTVQNTSRDLLANVSALISNSNEEYFSINANLAKTNLTAGEATTLTVRVELIKKPILEKETSTIGIQLNAEPVQP